MIPENEIPHIVPVSIVLIRTPDVAVSIAGLVVYSTAVQFTLAARFRYLPDGVQGDGLHLELTSPQHSDDINDADRHLHLELECADRRLLTERAYDLDYSTTRSQPLIQTEACSAGPNGFDANLLVQPVPLEELLTFISSWPLFRVPEQRYELADDLHLSTLAASIEPLWPLPTSLTDP